MQCIACENWTERIGLYIFYFFVLLILWIFHKFPFSVVCEACCWLDMNKEAESRGFFFVDQLSPERGRDLTETNDFVRSQIWWYRPRLTLQCTRLQKIRTGRELFRMSGEKVHLHQPGGDGVETEIHGILLYVTQTSHVEQTNHFFWQFFTN